MSEKPDPAHAQVNRKPGDAPATDDTPKKRDPEKRAARLKQAEAAAAAGGERPARIAGGGAAKSEGQAQPLKVRRLQEGAGKNLPAQTGKGGGLAKPAGGGLARPAAQQPSPPPPQQPVRPPVSSAQPKRRHWALLTVFLLIVVLPSLVTAWYLWARASDQYVSAVGFSVRHEDAQPSVDLLGGLAALGGGSTGASDTDILYQYILSPDMVETIDKQLNLTERFSREWPADPVFAYDPDGTLEDLTDYWARQVKVYYDSSSGLITLNVAAFVPEDAQAIAAAILKESTSKINELSSVAREDATRLAREELEKARVELTTTRQEMTAFRMRTQIVDPQADLAGQMGVLTQLQTQLAEQMVQHDLLLENARPTDNRVIQSQQKIDALNKLIDAERSKFGRDGHGPAGESYAQLMAEYEKLAVDREFAEGAYRGARIAYESALAEAQRQSRYLAAHITPRMPQASTEPHRLRLLALTVGLLLIAWSIMTLIYYSVRDRG